MRQLQDLFQWILLGSLLAMITATSVVEDTNYWMRLGREAVKDALKIKKVEGIAKNVILFIGDGMGLPTITAGRIFKGQLEGRTGEEGYLSFEKFHNVGLLKTYNVDRQVPDSAGTATALFSGVKGNYYTVGLDATVTFNVCRKDVEEKARVSSILDWAIEAGKSTGLVTTTRITHATPAAVYAHCVHRDWECDSVIPETERGKGCKDIARQLVEEEPGRSINVVLGGGEQTLRATVNASSACTRSDNKDLVNDWMRWQKSKETNYQYVRNKQELLDADENLDRLLGLFSPSHLPYDKDRDDGPQGQPSLVDMTVKAIKMLTKNTKGFVLIVEGGRIDHAHHDNYAKIALEELVEFDRAIEKALSMTKAKDTLIVVTADHSHSMGMNGYPKRGNPIEGVGDVTPEGFSYQTLSYINGPGYDYHRLHINETHAGTASENHATSTLNTWRNLNLTTENNGNRNQQHFAGFWMDYETHGGEDVPVYASGPMGHLFHGVHEQTHVPFTIAYSACIGPYWKTCRTTEGANADVSIANLNTVSWLLSSTLFLRALL